VILLDTHAVIWMAKRHARARVLARYPRLYLSPVTLLELQFLAESGRIRFAGDHPVQSVVDDPRWRLDEPPAADLFLTACQFAWTKDPFDRLLAAHARLRGWRLATADAVILDSLQPSDVVRL
jgi:PIN domain nuclease of toxin-antitoxin system